MRTPTQKQRPRKAQVTMLPAPTGGLVSNRNLAVARGPELPPGAAVLENWFPTATGAITRRGMRRWATLGDDPVKAMFTYVSGAQKQMFAADDNAIYNVTSIPSPYSWILSTDNEEEAISPDVPGEVALGEQSVQGFDVFTDTTSGDWVVVQFGTAGGNFLMGVNGVDQGFIYDGTTFYPNVAGGVYGLNFDAEAGAFTVGETVTGGTSAATAEILKVISDGSTGTLWIKDIVEVPEVREITYSGGVGSFTVSGTLTGTESGATATIDADAAGTLTLSDVSGSFDNGEVITDGGAATTASAEIATRWEMEIKTVVQAFVVDETITGGTSGATAIVLEVDGTTLILRNLDGTFTANEALTGSAGGDAEVDTAEAATTWVMTFEDLLADFTAADTLLGATSAATATISTVSVGSEGGSFVLTGLTGNFVSGEIITDGASATSTSVDTYVSGGAFQDDETITDGDTGSATADGGATLLSVGVSFPDGVDLDTSDLSYVWVYKNRIYFIQNDSLDAWYLPVDQVGGELTKFPLGGVFPRGGVLLWGQAWSLDNSGSGGLSEQCVFTTTEGEVAAYQGLSPDPGQDWTKVGAYRVGRPMGKKGFIRAGGDLVIATTVGFISLAAASRKDYAALGQNAVSYPIEDDWVLSQQLRGQEDWRCQVWAEGQMTLVAPPTPEGQSPIVYVVNTNTGKWATFTGWDITAMTQFQGGIYFGSSDGAVRQGWIGGSDEDAPYVCRSLPLFDSMNAPASLKLLKMGRVVTRAAYAAKIQLSGQSNFVVNFPAAPSQSAIPGGNEWDNGVWGESVWDATRASIITGDWVSLGNYGHDVSIGVQVTSGATVPLDVELIRIDVTYSTGDVGT